MASSSSEVSEVTMYFEVTAEGRRTRRLEQGPSCLNASSHYERSCHARRSFPGNLHSIREYPSVAIATRYRLLNPVRTDYRKSFEIQTAHPEYHLSTEGSYVYPLRSPLVCANGATRYDRLGGETRSSFRSVMTDVGFPWVRVLTTAILRRYVDR